MENELNKQIMNKINELSFITKTEKDREFLVNSIKDLSFINNFENTSKNQPILNKDVLENLLKYNNMAIIIDFTLHGKRQICAGILTINKPFSNVPYVSLINNQKVVIPFLNINSDGIHSIKNSDGTTLYTDKNLLNQEMPKLEQVCKMYGTATATDILLKNISKYINYISQKPILESTTKPANIAKKVQSKYKLDSEIGNNKAIDVAPTSKKIIPLKKDNNIQVPNMHI